MTHTNLTTRLLAGGTPLRNQLLCSLPTDVYDVVAKDLRAIEVAPGEVLHEHGVVVTDVYFPNGGVFSVTTPMRDGRSVEVATAGREGMLGVSVFLGDRMGTGQTLLQIPGGVVPVMSAAAFTKHVSPQGPFREAISRYTQTTFLQVMQTTACNALHVVEERCCRWLLQTHDRVDGDEFLLKQEFLAVMLGVSRQSVTVVMGTLQKAGLISTHYGRIQILDRKNLERASCECYQAIIGHFERLKA
jgi:CRP-like cAMP-binding protein